MLGPPDAGGRRPEHGLYHGQRAGGGGSLSHAGVVAQGVRGLPQRGTTVDSRRHVHPRGAGRASRLGPFDVRRSGRPGRRSGGATTGPVPPRAGARRRGHRWAGRRGPPPGAVEGVAGRGGGGAGRDDVDPLSHSDSGAHHMRSRSLGIVVSLVLLAPVGAGLSAQGRGQDTRPGIAVLPFDNSGSYGQDKENFDALQKGIAGMLISELAANPAARVVEREEIEKLLAEQSLGASGKVTPETAAKIGKLVGARYVIVGTFIDFYGDFRLDVRLVNVETSEIVKVESDRMQRDHLFDIIRTVAARLMKDTNLPPLPRQASDQLTNRQIPTEALTFYSKALLFQDRGQKDKAAEMYQRALAVFPEYTEAQQGLQRMKNS